MMCYLGCMERIGVRELRQHASRYLDRVKAGETLKITERGRPVARLTPPGPDEQARERLINAGLLVPASQPFTLPRRREASPDAPGSGEVLDRMREERL